MKNKGLRALGATCVAFYLVLQTWQVLHIQRWWMQPDRYLISREIQHVRDHAKPGEAVIYHPQVLEVLGRYYHLPADTTAEAELYDGNKLKKDANLSPNFGAPSAAVIVGMVNYDERLKTARRVLDAVAEHYGTTINPASLDRDLQLERVLSATFSADQVQMHSRGLHDDTAP